MAQYVTIPKDLSEIKQKFFAGLTKRQCICFGIGAVMGVPVFFLTKDFLGTTMAVNLMAVLALPAIICGFYRKNGLYLEQVVINMLRYYQNTRILTYQSENIFIKISDEIEYQKLRLKLRAAGVYTRKKKTKNVKFKIKR